MATQGHGQQPGAHLSLFMPVFPAKIVAGSFMTCVRSGTHGHPRPRAAACSAPGTVHACVLCWKPCVLSSRYLACVRSGSHGHPRPRAAAWSAPLSLHACVLS